jgi:hypothetical protein
VTFRRIAPADARDPTYWRDHEPPAGYVVWPPGTPNAPRDLSEAEASLLRFAVEHDSINLAEATDLCGDWLRDELAVSRARVLLRRLTDRGLLARHRESDAQYRPTRGHGDRLGEVLLQLPEGE